MTRSGELATAHRFDLLRELLADDFVRADHRTGVSAPVANGPDEFVTAYAAWFEVGFDRLSITPLAVRGERLALARLEWSSADGRTVGFLGVYETNVDGRFVRGAHFDEDDLDAALAELDERYLAGEGAEHEYLVRRLGDLRTAQAAPRLGRDRGAGGGRLPVRRSPTDGAPRERPGRLRRRHARVEEQTPGVRMIHRSLDVRGDVVLARTGRVGATPDGLEYEWEQIAVMVWAAGLLRRVELFAVTDGAAARARFEELADASRLTPYVDNRLVRISRARTVAGPLRRRRARGFYRDDCVLDDRRPGVNAGDGAPAPTRSTPASSPASTSSACSSSSRSPSAATGSRSTGGHSWPTAASRRPGSA